MKGQLLHETPSEELELDGMELLLVLRKQPRALY
jgi:hypothetical protein